MKKRMSAAALALRMTWKWVLVLTVLICGLQIFLFQWSSGAEWGGLDVWKHGFEWVLDEYHIGTLGKAGFFGILLAVLVTVGRGKSRSVYTLRRLRISENEVTVLWAAVFAGYFLLFWAIQLGLALWMFSRFRVSQELNGLEFFIIAHRSAWLHTLLPLSEPWGFVRNIALCLGWGTMGSLMARSIRHGGRPIVGLIALLASAFLLIPRRMATQMTDVLFLIAMVGVVAVQIMMNGEVERNAG